LLVRGRNPNAALTIVVATTIVKRKKTQVSSFTQAEMGLGIPRVVTGIIFAARGFQEDSYE
jgi:hypothetical protein